MKKAFFFIIVLFIVFMNNTNAQSQTIVTKKWASSIGRPDTVNWASSTFDSYGCLTVTGSKYVGSNNTDVFVVKYDISGNIMWQTTYNGTSSTLDYGVAIVAGTNGDVYVAAATTTVGSGLDMAILKYSSAGTLTWTAKWTGTGSFNDVPSCIAVNSVGDIYIAGSTYAAATLYNYALIKYNSSGTKIWQSTYDYTAKTDFATAMVINSAGDVVITGSSAGTTTNWDFTTLKYAGESGALLNTNRINVPGHGQDVAVAIAEDDSDNIIITGYTYANSNYDIQTAKLSSALVSKWTKTFDGQGLDDAATDIGVDIHGNIFITGQTRKLNNGIDFITKKYNRAGTELWSNRYPADSETQYAKASKLFVESNGNVIIAGTADRINNSDIVAIEYDSSGILKWEKYFNGSGDTNDMALSVKCNNSGSVYLTGMSRDASDTMRYATIKYDYEILNNEAILDTVTDTSQSIFYIKDQVVVSFKPEYVNTAIVDNIEWQSGMLNEVILDSNYSNMIYEKLGLGSNYETGLKIYKIFKRMTTGDSLSITRLGDTIHMEPLWSAFILAIPSSLATLSAADSLNCLDTIIEFAEPNYVCMGAASADDPYYGDQSSLHARSGHPNESINIGPAWDIESGKYYVKVGILDSPIDWKHDEFGDRSYSGSKIKGGRDYVNSVNADKWQDFGDHGTACAGIIGAFRNNYNTNTNTYIGMAGIAGGDLGTFMNGPTGVDLYSLAIFTPKMDGGSESTMSDGLTEASSSTTNTYGFGLHIASCSWSGPNNGKLLLKAVRNCYVNGCAVFAARGNVPNNVGVKKLTAKMYPACYGDRLVFNIGGSGTDGKHKMKGYNGDAYTESMYDNGVDVIAPGSADIVLTTSVHNPPLQGDVYGADSRYQWFGGTSAATPHAAGVAALMMSRHNTMQSYPNNLHPDDVKMLFKKYSDDVTGLSPDPPQKYTYNTGPDIYNGWGRINAGKLLVQVDKQKGHFIQHIKSPSRVISTSTTLSTNIYLPEKIGAPKGHYDGYLVTITDQYTYTLPSSTYQIIDNWPINCLDKLGFSSNPTVTNTPYYTSSVSVSGTTATVTTVTYCWKLTRHHIFGTLLFFVPTIPSMISRDWSLEMYDPTLTSVAQKTIIASDLIIYPNPSSNQAIIDYGFNYEPKTINIDVYDLTGRFVAHIESINKSSGNISFDVGDWGTGVYFFYIKTDRETVVRKFIKD